MSENYLIPQFVIDYLQKSKNPKHPQNLLGTLLHKNKTPEIENWFKENEVCVSYIWRFFVIYSLNKFSFRECPICGKRLNLKTILRKPDAKYCSRNCSNSAQETKEKKEKVCLEKYGVENISQSEEFKDKVKQTNLKKYGVECYLQSEEFKDKAKKTILKRYGVENASQSKEIREKRKETNLKRYGVEYIPQSKTFNEKRVQTSLENYGVNFPIQSKEIKEKVKQTNLKKYGIEYIPQSKEFHKKTRKTCRVKYWEIFCEKLKERNIIPLFMINEYINDTGRKFKCLCCNGVFESEGTCNYRKKHQKNNDGSYTTLLTQNIFCPYCFKSHISKKEKEVLEFVRTIYNGEILENDRIQLDGKELDIFLPSLNIGIEFDGTYWHSLEKAKERDAKKNHLCEQKGIKLFRIKESEWDNNRKDVENRIKDFLI